MLKAPKITDCRMQKLKEKTSKVESLAEGLTKTSKSGVRAEGLKPLKPKRKQYDSIKPESGDTKTGKLKLKDHSNFLL